ncbi:MAG: transporter substrate-binding domain-containing protein [Candidatus Lokiarchaeota archaeon]|nr:transporter substrate-binding domain-containing protein [Candidatus Lokiarchaeota archaeon]
MAEEENWNIEWIEGSWTECLDQLEAGEIDMMVDVAYSKTRDDLYDFNNISVFTNWGIIYADNPGKLLTFEDLEGKTIAVMTDSIHTDGDFGIKNLTSVFGISCSLIEVDNYTAVFEKVQSGEADGGVVNRLFGNLNGKDYGLIKTSLIFNPVDLMFAFPPSAPLNTQLIERIDYHLQVLQDDPESSYYQLLNQYFLDVNIVERIPEWIIYIIIAISMTVLVSVVMSIKLNKTVEEKTQEIKEKNITLQNDLELRKKIEKSLKETEYNLELLNEILLETIPNMVIFIHEDGEISLVNENFKEIYSIIYGFDLDNKMNISKLPDNNLTEAIKSSLLEFKQNNVEIEHREMSKTINLENDTYYELFTSKIILKSKEYKMGVLFVFNNITPFIELENLRRQFISTVSHELRTPITSINLSINNLLKYRDKLDREKKDKIFEMMKKSGKVLSEMIEDLLIASRIENKKITLETSEFFIKDAIEEVVLQLSPGTKSKNITIKKEINKNAEIKADYKRICQIIRILLDNAIKYSPDNTKIRIKTSAEYNEFYDKNKENGILISVMDEGIGIPEKDLSNIFSKFHRGSNVKNISGTGLGLNIAKSLTKLHGGEIKVESTIGVGTKFHIFLPISKEKEKTTIKREEDFQEKKDD